mgnify:FL=1
MNHIVLYIDLSKAEWREKPTPPTCRYKYECPPTAERNEIYMLSALCVREPRRRWLSLRRRPPAVYSELVSAGSGKFLKITAEVGRNGNLNWADIRHAAGRESSRLLLPQVVTPPQNSRITAFQGVELSRRLMSSAAVKLLKIVAVNPRLVKVTVYDPQAVMPDLPLMFLPFAADVGVITRRPERYEVQCYTAMQQYGAVLSVSMDLAVMDGSLLLLAPDEPEDSCRELKQMISRHGWVLTARSPKSQSEQFDKHIDYKGVIHGYIPRVSNCILDAKPPGCDAAQFLAGLFELSSVREIASKPPEFLQTGGHIIALKDAAWRLACCDTIDG